MLHSIHECTKLVNAALLIRIIDRTQHLEKQSHSFIPFLTKVK